jgi:integrase
MPTPELMSWVPSQKLWRKRYTDPKWFAGLPVSRKYKWFTRSPRQLSDQFGESVPETREGSARKANLAWQLFEHELFMARQPKPVQATPREERVLVEEECKTGEAALDFLRDLEAKGIRQETINLLYREMVERRLIRGEAQKSCVRDVVGEEEAARLDRPFQEIRGDSAQAIQMTIKEAVDQYLGLQRGRVGLSQVAGSLSNKIRAVGLFVAYLGPDRPMSDLAEGDLDGFFGYCGDKIKSGEWSPYTARDVFSQARKFVRWAYERKLAPRPLNIDSRDHSFKVSPGQVETWTPEEFKAMVREATDRTKLYLLLMGNAGMYPQDIADLQDSEVDWDLGTITRKRSKTKGRKNVPTVTYPLWPVTLRLLKQFRSNQPTVLLSEDGTKLMRQGVKEDGRVSKTNTLIRAVDRLKKRTGFNKPIKEIRKMSADLINQHERFAPVAPLFLGHAAGNLADRHYLKARLSLLAEAVNWLGEYLGQKR